MKAPTLRLRSIGTAFLLAGVAGGAAPGRGQELESVAGRPPAPGQRVILITGSTGGLGREVARRLAAAGDHVIVHGRDLQRGSELVAEIQEEGRGSARFYAADFASFREVRALARAIARDYARLDVLVNNAGIWLEGPRRLSEDGCELHFQVNYLAGFLLTRELLPLLRESAPARIVNVSSMAQRPIDFDNVMLEEGYSDGRAYAQSKLAQVMFTLDLATELEGTGVTANALHPATMMDTDMVLERGAQTRSSVQDGAEAVVHLVNGGELGSGEYFNQTTPTRANDQAYDGAARARLRALSQRLTGSG
jgi:NAD(P)-dependent dehydrogenase (short-subunit alcohol dehydrogenase family)